MDFNYLFFSSLSRSKPIASFGNGLRNSSRRQSFQQSLKTVDRVILLLAQI